MTTKAPTATSTFMFGGRQITGPADQVSCIQYDLAYNNLDITDIAGNFGMLRALAEKGFRVVRDTPAPGKTH